jgi:hypothetical protein
MNILAYDAVVPVIVKCPRAAGLSRAKASKTVGATRE